MDAKHHAASICGIISRSGPNGEPLACGYLAGHTGMHAWASLPTFTPADPDPAPCGYDDSPEPGEDWKRAEYEH